MSTGGLNQPEWSPCTRLHAVAHREEVCDVFDVFGMVDVDKAELASPRLGYSHFGARSLFLTYMEQEIC